MSNSSRFKTVARICLAVACLPLCLAGTCPQPMTCPAGQTLVNGVCTITPTPTTLLDLTQASVGVFNFNPTSSGKAITCSVAGNATNSRPSLLVVDFNGAVQINKTTVGSDVTSNTTSGTFTSSGTGVHVITSVELGTAAASYHVLVTQAP